MLNNNKANYYIENIKKDELIENQRKIIIKLSNDIANKDLTITYLSSQLCSVANNQTVNDLLEIN